MTDGDDTRGRTRPVDQPAYSAHDLSVGIVHFGVGNFHRSHQAMYLDRLFSLGRSRQWAICGVGILPGDAVMRDALTSQNMRYTLVERVPDGSTPARSIASIVEYLFGPDDPDAVCERLADPAVGIVSLTITEGGYRVDDSGEFDADQDDIRHDLESGALPRTVFGFVTEGLRRRRERGIAPFTIMSCDNLAGNGSVARRSFVSFATLLDPDLGAWIDREVRFPSSMVDRITPVTTDEDRRWVEDTFGVRDAWPVVSESFVQWVLEDDFSLGRPEYETVGVQVVDDVEPYERMKLRLLNGSHQALAYAGYLLGHRYAHEAAADPLTRDLVVAYMDEAQSTLGPVPGIDLADYRATLLERFGNPYVRDTLLRLATDGSDRISKWVLPVIVDRLADEQSVAMSTAIVAAWATFSRDVVAGAIDVRDRQADRVAEAVARQELDPVGFLRDPRIFGDLVEAEAFSDVFASSYRVIRDRGIGAFLESVNPTQALP